MSDNLRAKTIRLAASMPLGSKNREALLNLLAEDKVAIRLPNEGEDNTWGGGYIPLPPRLHHLGRFADMFKAPLDHKVFLKEGIHMITVKANTKFSLFAADLQSLLRNMGLVRIQVNNPGTVSFYFKAEADEPLSPTLK